MKVRVWTIALGCLLIAMIALLGVSCATQQKPAEPGASAAPSEPVTPGGSPSESGPAASPFVSAPAQTEASTQPSASAPTASATQEPTGTGATPGPGGNTAKPTPTETQAVTPGMSTQNVPDETTPTGAITKKPKVTPKATKKPTVTPKPTKKPTVTPKPTKKPAVTPKPTKKPSATATPKPTAKPVASKPKFGTATASQGYVTVTYKKPDSKKYKVRLENGSSYENYTLQGSGKAESFPVKLGSGTYKLMVLQNISGTSYRVIASTTFTVKASNTFGPYLQPNPHVNYTSSMSCIKFSKQLASGKSDAGKVSAFYSWIVSNVRYDFDKKAPSGYLPNPDTTYKTRKGICYDYASLFASMCRANGIPAKLCIGTAKGVQGLHAWNSVYYNGSWHRYDPTTAAQGGKASNYSTQRSY